MSINESQLELEERYNELLRERAQLQGRTASAESDQQEIQRSTNSIMRDRQKETRRSNRSQKDLAGQLERSAKSQNKYNKSLAEGSKQAGIMAKMMGTLKQGYEGVIKPLMALYDLITMKSLYNGLIELGAAYSGQMKEMYQATQQLKDVVGDLAGPGGRRYNTFVRNLRSSTSALAQSGKSLGSVFGLGVADTMKGVTELIKEMGVAMDLTLDSIRGAEGEFVLLGKGLGISGEALGKMARGSKNAKKEFTELAVNIASGAKKFGISMKAAGMNVDAALKDVNNFGYMSKKELTETALYATRLGMEMKDLTSFADKFDTFEGAAESVGKLSSAFGIQLDTMEMVMEDNPAKKLDMVRKALEQQGKTMDSVLGDRRQAKYLADTIGIPIDKLKELQKTSTDEFGFDTLADEMGENELMSEKDALNEIAKQMKSLNDAFKDVSGVKSFFGAFKKGFGEAFARSPAYRKMMGAINRSLQKFFRVGEKVAGMVSKLFYNPKYDKQGKLIKNAAVLGDIFDGFMEYFNEMGKMADGLKGGPIGQVFEIIEGFAKGDVLSGDQANIFEILFGPFASMDPNKKAMGVQNPKIRKGVVKLLRIIGNIMADAFTFIGDASTKWVDMLFQPKAIEQKVGKSDKKQQEDSLMPVAQRLGEAFMVSMGKIFENTGRIASGIGAYLIGGEGFFGTFVKYEDSVFGKLMNTVRDFMERPRDFTRGRTAGGDLGEFIVGMLGFDQAEEVMKNKTATFGDAMKLMFAELKLNFFKLIGEMGQELQNFAIRALAARRGDQGALYNLNPMVSILEGMADMGGAVAAAGFGKAKDARKEIEAIRATVVEESKKFEEMEKAASEIGLITGTSTTEETVAALSATGGSFTDPRTGISYEPTKQNLQTIYEMALDYESRGGSFENFIRYGGELPNEPGVTQALEFDEVFLGRSAQNYSDLGASKGFENLSGVGLTGGYNLSEAGKNMTYDQMIANLGALGLNTSAMEQLYTKNPDNIKFMREFYKGQIQAAGFDVIKKFGTFEAGHTDIDPFSGETSIDPSSIASYAAGDYHRGQLGKLAKTLGDLTMDSNAFQEGNAYHQNAKDFLEFMMMDTPEAAAVRAAFMSQEAGTFRSKGAIGRYGSEEGVIAHVAEKMGITGFEKKTAADIGMTAGGEVIESMALGIEEYASSLADSPAIASAQSSIADATDVLVDKQNPAMVGFNAGVYLTESFIAGAFGDNKVSAGSEATGMAARFSAEMEKVQQTIVQSYQDIADISTIAVETKLGRLGNVLKGEKPMHVVVTNEKVDIKLQLKVVMDTKDIAFALMEPEDQGGSYFRLNRMREGTLDFGELVEEQEKQYAPPPV